jgi:hypothetical protein
MTTASQIASKPNVPEPCARNSYFGNVVRFFTNRSRPSTKWRVKLSLHPHHIRRHRRLAPLSHLILPLPTRRLRPSSTWSGFARQNRRATQIVVLYRTQRASKSYASLPSGWAQATPPSCVLLRLAVKVSKLRQTAFWAVVMEIEAEANTVSCLNRARSCTTSTRDRAVDYRITRDALAMLHKFHPHPSDFRLPHPVHLPRILKL